MKINFVRTLRTQSSERFLLLKGDKDIGALDVHYLINGSVAATVIILDSSNFPASNIPSLLNKIDEILFPDISISEKNLVFTVVTGCVLGTFFPENNSNKD